MNKVCIFFIFFDFLAFLTMEIPHNQLVVKIKVRLDNDVSELEILGHVGTCWDILGQSEDFLTSFEHLDCFPKHFRPFSPIIGSLKEMRYGPTD